MDGADHRQVVAALDRGLRAELTRRQDRAGLWHLAGHAGLALATGTWIAWGLPGWPAVLFVHGIILTFLFTLEHETTHKTPFATPWLNEAVGQACALVIALPFTWFRYFHLEHHRFTGDPNRDPELQGGGRPTTWRAYLIYLSGWGYWRGAAQTLWTCAFGRLTARYVPKGAIPRIRAEARVMLAVYALAAVSLFWSPLLLWLWIVPLILGQPFLRAYLLAEHAGCDEGDDMFTNTRTTFTTRAVRFLAWNMPYHAEHHAWPQVPYHQLPRLHDAVEAHLRHTAPGYAPFNRAYARELGHRTQGRELAPRL